MQSQCTASKEAKPCTLPHTSMNISSLHIFSVNIAAHLSRYFYSAHCRTPQSIFLLCTLSRCTLLYTSINISSPHIFSMHIAAHLNEYFYSAHFLGAHCRTPQWIFLLCTFSRCTLPHTSMNAAAQAGGKNLPIFSSASFTDSAAANKYLNAIIKSNCKRRSEMATNKEWRLNSWRQPSVSEPGADFSVLIVGGGWLIKW